MSSQLTPSELCQLLNYIIGLPVKRLRSGGLVRREGLHPVVVSCWTAKRRIRIVVWAESILVDEGVLPRESPKGRRTVMPLEVRRWTGFGEICEPS